MLRSIRQLRNCSPSARDGELGRVVDVFFDDQAWAVRYLVVDTNRWLAGRRVLISPSALGEVDEKTLTLPLLLTKDQVRNSPDVSTHLPVSRQREHELAAHYGWPMYWMPGLWEAGQPETPPRGMWQEPAATTATVPQAKLDETDAHLRSAREVIGYHLRALDGSIGHVEDFLVEDTEWMIRYLIIETRNFWPGKNVLISPQSVRQIDWAEAQIAVDLTKDSIQNAPEHDPHQPVAREYEDELHRYYGWGPYWL